jgi:hypothetical protein
MTEEWLTFTTPITTHITALHIVVWKHKWRLRTCCAIMSFFSYCLKSHCNNTEPVRAARHRVLIKERNVRNNGIRTWFCDDTRLCDINVVRSKLSCPGDHPELLARFQLHCAQKAGTMSCISWRRGFHHLSRNANAELPYCRIGVRCNVPVPLADRRLLTRIHQRL